MPIFGRSSGEVQPGFIPGDGHQLQPLGNEENMIGEAMILAKSLNQRTEVGLADRIVKMDAMNVSTALDFLDGLSDAEREKYLIAEKKSKGRRMILGRYGW